MPVRSDRPVFPAIMLAIIAASFFFYASSSGITGVTRKPGGSPGCTCHNANPSSAVTVTINGPASLNPGQQGNYTLTVSGGPLAAAGTNIAASGGTLATADATLRLQGGELTHTSPKTPSSGTVTFSFKFTAPSTPGSVTLYANGNSVNLAGGNSGDSWNFAADKAINVVTDINDPALVNGFTLGQNFPNPFNPSTTISFSLASAGYVALDVYDLSGSKVATVASGYFTAGAHTANFNAAGLSSGVYYYKLSAAGFSEVKKMIISK